MSWQRASGYGTVRRSVRRSYLHTHTYTKDTRICSSQTGRPITHTHTQSNISPDITQSSAFHVCSLSMRLFSLPSPFLSLSFLPFSLSNFLYYFPNSSLSLSPLLCSFTSTLFLSLDAVFTLTFSSLPLLSLTLVVLDLTFHLLSSILNIHVFTYLFPYYQFTPSPPSLLKVNLHFSHSYSYPALTIPFSPSHSLHHFSLHTSHFLTISLFLTTLLLSPNLFHSHNFLLSPLH